MNMDIDDSQNFWPTVQLIMAIVTEINNGNDNKFGDLKQYDGRMRTRFILPRTWTCGHGNEHSGYIQFK
jgi:hypothetical protein